MRTSFLHLFTLPLLAAMLIALGAVFAHHSGPAQAQPQPSVSFQDAQLNGGADADENLDPTVSVTLTIDPVLSSASVVKIRALTGDPDHTAERGDYILPQRVTLPANAATATFNIRLRDDNLAEIRDVIVVGLEAVDNAPYTLGATRRATLGISDNDIVTVSFLGTGSSYTRGGDTYTAYYEINEGTAATVRVVIDKTAEYPIYLMLEGKTDSWSDTSNATSADGDYTLSPHPSRGAYPDGFAPRFPPGVEEAPVYVDSRSSPSNTKAFIVIPPGSRVPKVPSPRVIAHQNLSIHGTHDFESDEFFLLGLSIPYQVPDTVRTEIGPDPGVVKIIETTHIDGVFCPGCSLGPQTRLIHNPGPEHDDLIAQMYDWRDNDPVWSSRKSHTDRWDRALLAFGENVVDPSIKPMTAAEAQAWADSGLTRWAPVAEALHQLEAAARRNPQPDTSDQEEPEPETPNRAPTVAVAFEDVTIVHESGTEDVSLVYLENDGLLTRVLPVFEDPDGDDLTIAAASSDKTVAAASVTSSFNLRVSAKSRGTATITVTADDGRGGTVSDTFEVTVKAAPKVLSALPDISGLEKGATRDVSLSGVFSDADGDALTIDARSDNRAVARAGFSLDGSALVVQGGAAGDARITVKARDTDGNQAFLVFDVSVVAAQLVQQTPPEEEEETEAETSIVTVKSTPQVASQLADVNGLTEGTTRDVSLSGAFSDADGDALTITASSDFDNVAIVTVASDYSSLTVSGVSSGWATITVVAQDPDGNRAEQVFDVEVTDAAPQKQSVPEKQSVPQKQVRQPTAPTPTPEPETEEQETETEPEISEAVARYDSNGDGAIDFQEYIRAANDYFDGNITYAEMLEVATAYQAS